MVMSRLSQSSKPADQRTGSLEFPGGLVVRIWCFHCRGLDSIPGPGTTPLEYKERASLNQLAPSRPGNGLCFFLDEVPL